MSKFKVLCKWTFSIKVVKPSFSATYFKYRTSFCISDLFLHFHFCSKESTFFHFPSLQGILLSYSPSYSKAALQYSLLLWADAETLKICLILVSISCLCLHISDKINFYIVSFIILYEGCTNKYKYKYKYKYTCL